VIVSNLLQLLTDKPGTELRHILAVYIMCPCDPDLWSIFPKLGHVTHRAWWIYVPIAHKRNHLNFCSLRITSPKRETIVHSSGKKTSQTKAVTKSADRNRKEPVDCMSD